MARKTNSDNVLLMVIRIHKFAHSVSTVATITSPAHATTDVLISKIKEYFASSSQWHISRHPGDIIPKLSASILTRHHYESYAKHITVT